MASLPPVLYACRLAEQAAAMQSIAREMDEAEAWFLPSESGWFVETIFPGRRETRRCLEYLRQHGLRVDRRPPSRSYGVVVTLPDLLLPARLGRFPCVLVQDGSEIPEPLNLPGMRYDRVCVRDEAARSEVAAAGYPESRLIVVGSDDGAPGRIAGLCRELLVGRSVIENSPRSHHAAT